MKKIESILIANRGEIADRITQTCKKMKITSVGIYSDLDANLPYLKNVDIKVPLNGTYSYDTYLNIEKIIKIAIEQKVDAIHPGYGFLSENYLFAKATEDAGLIFIGPNQNAIKMLGDKINSKKIAKEANVNLIPGFIGNIDINDQKMLNKIISEIGFPLIIKASAGGGGKGIKIVQNESELHPALISAQNEAISNFKNPDIFIEKYIQNPRHIEIQIIADKHGNIIALTERECTIQRFNQKVIEESPSISISSKTRELLKKQAINLAKLINYDSVGTVEFVMDKEENFYFLEVNTRLQVEHRVTELIHKIDIVQEMIQIAEGQQISTEVAITKSIGHAIECRICAEDPTKNFLPSTGIIKNYIKPTEDKNLILDFTIQNGSFISQFYDAMIGKIIIFADTRNEVIVKMKTALGELDIQGIQTNIHFLESVFRNQKFLDNNISTNFIKEEYPNGFQNGTLNNTIIQSMIGAAIILFENENEKLYENYLQDSKRFILIDNAEYTISLEELTNFYIKFKLNGLENLFKYEINYTSNIITANINNAFLSIKYRKSRFGYRFYVAGCTSFVRIFDRDVFSYLKFLNTAQKQKPIKSLISPINGLIKKINYQEGDIIKPFQTICVLESMKMENNLSLPIEVKVKKIHISLLNVVAKGKILFEFE